MIRSEPNGVKLLSFRVKRIRGARKRAASFLTLIYLTF